MKTTQHSFHAMSDRYQFDSGLCAEFAQVDTRQDASYYGTWANPTTRQIVCYCEGDLTIDTYDTDEEFTAGMIELWEWNEDRIGGDFGVDCGWPLIDGDGIVDRLTEGFKKLGLGDLLH